MSAGLSDNRPQLRSARLLLRPLAMADLPEYIALLDDWQVARWLSRVPSPYTMEDAEYWLAKTASKWQAREELALVACKQTDGKIIGGISLFFVDGEIGFWVAGSEAGQGFGREMLRAMIDYAFTKTNLPEVFCASMPENEASRAVQRAVGMKFIGEKPYEFNPARCASQTAPMYVMTRQDWLNRIM